jgi:hypothetical protein
VSVHIYVCLVFLFLRLFLRLLHYILEFYSTVRYALFRM